MRFQIIPAAILLAASAFCAAQAAPEQGGNEIQIWTAGGHSVPGGTARTGVFTAGLRYGWILTGPHLPSVLRGRFEYAIDATPLFLVFQRANTAYGVGFGPLGLKWNFDHRGRLSPYLELNGGILVTPKNLSSSPKQGKIPTPPPLRIPTLGWKYKLSLEH